MDYLRLDLDKAIGKGSQANYGIGSFVGSIFLLHLKNKQKEKALQICAIEIHNEMKDLTKTNGIIKEENQELHQRNVNLFERLQVLEHNQNEFIDDLRAAHKSAQDNIRLRQENETLSKLNDIHNSEMESVEHRQVFSEVALPTALLDELHAASTIDLTIEMADKSIQTDGVVTSPKPTLRTRQTQTQASVQIQISTQTQSKQNQSGFSVSAVIATVGILSFTGIYVWRKWKQKHTKATDPVP
ncbi:hypothetical protein RFI_11719 [Reticulomyxa filosa]|uniref:Uncharacterized protein n=1 Tax=Reticulomyxa filosa TaxID=46433 RepID=X6NJA7_RETFI|nr:hypothetical protein RFI_11719 [Reticulomyxa filosa]|eukprot:ETO25417.1 hypothetical protein RFI_11719 [Reticulomyxa filosa]